MPDMVNVRKSHAGTDSAGHTWLADGAAIAVPVEHALVLARIPDGGFTLEASPVAEAAVGAAEPETTELSVPKPPAKASRGSTSPTT
ncbi:hypothetical protein KGQ19_16120 [Catenulispora sp. NL8]|uniref:Uncharacterized protein n=1 Tax=Catenulispora pinistramenti TaxID=2705254 RepID=A0ABS5KQR8_9ACTN|nr:hypothetical protein [Catenulispora pinistramenti]MBS2548393.1 hypothetical protein [Catenulispora pinistramenti]